MPEKHHRILLCPENREREIKRGNKGEKGDTKKQRARVFHTLLVFSFGGSVD